MTNTKRQDLNINEDNTTATVLVLLQYDKKGERHCFGIYNTIKGCLEVERSLNASGYKTMIQENFIKFND